MSVEPSGIERRSPEPYRRWRWSIVVLLAGVVAACTSSETSVTAPSSQRCAVTVTNSMETVPASGGAGTITVAASRDCTWAASNGAPWIVLTAATNGQGDGTISYRVAANGDPAQRRSSIDVNNTAAAIVQEAAACNYTVTPSNAAIPAPGGNVAVRVQTNSACAWTAVAEASWARVTSGGSGQGDGNVTIVVDANGSAPRSARAVVAGTPVTLDQAGEQSTTPAPPPPSPPPPGCSYSIQPNGQTIPAGGGPGFIDVTASGGTCAWTTVSNTGWVTITGGASASGTGRATFSVAGNSGGSRTGSISVAGHTFTVTQAGVSCSYSINPSSDAIAAAGGTSTIAVTTGGSCAWSAGSNASWISVTSGASGTGTGTVKLNIAANSGAARTGTATIAAQTFTVTQAAAPCNFSLTPAIVDMPPSGGSSRTNVSAGAGCAWSAVSNDAWITLTGETSDVGNGVVRFTVDANTGAARSGTVRIAGQTLTVTQPAACSFVITPTSQTIASPAASGSVTVTTGPTCAWSAASNTPDWLTISSAASGTGNGSISYSATANAGPSRVGTLTIAGQTFTLTQDAPCTFSINPTGQTIGAAGGSGLLSVTTGASCPWMATSNNSDWLTITGGASGSGNGQVMFSIGTNGTGADRTGTITAAGHTFTVTQTAQ
jgi:hypothetical protein